MLNRDAVSIDFLKTWFFNYFVLTRSGFSNCNWRWNIQNNSRLNRPYKPSGVCAYEYSLFSSWYVILLRYMVYWVCCWDKDMNFSKWRGLLIRPVSCVHGPGSAMPLRFYEIYIGCLLGSALILKLFLIKIWLLLIFPLLFLPQLLRVIIFVALMIVPFFDSFWPNHLKLLVIVLLWLLLLGYGTPSHETLDLRQVYPVLKLSLRRFFLRRLFHS